MVVFQRCNHVKGRVEQIAFAMRGDISPIVEMTRHFV